jgi:hypothetical protein
MNPLAHPTMTTFGAMTSSSDDPIEEFLEAETWVQGSFLPENFAALCSGRYDLGADCVLCPGNDCTPGRDHEAWSC